MRIPDEIFEEILHANDIVDVISSYVTVKRRGKSFLALCPFHPDKNPSMHISQDRQVYHCFSCKAGGNVITFVQEYEKISSMEAVEKLAQRIGINLGKFSAKPEVSNEIAKLYEINKIAARLFYDNLVNVGGEEREMVYDYLKNRGLEKDTLTKFGIGYARAGWHSLENYFIEEGTYTREDLELAGLLIKSEKDGKFHDRYRGRLIFPIFNEGGKVIGFGGRVIKKDDDSAKYINSPETRVYYKSKTLYGLNFAKDHIRSHDSVLLVEGYMDVVSLAHAGIQNVVASSGTALTEEQVHLISRYTKNIFLIYDADLAGIKAAKRGIEIILEQGLNIKVVSLPDGEDPDSYVRSKGQQEFEKQLQFSKSVINFISDTYKNAGKLSTPEEKSDFVKEIIQYLVRIPDKIRISFYVKELSDTYQLYESDLRDELNRAYADYKKTQFPKTSVVLPVTSRESKKDKDKRPSQAEVELVGLFVKCDYKNKSYIPGLNYLVDNLYIDYITNATILKAVELLLDEWHNDGKIDVAKLLSTIEDEEVRNLLHTQSSQLYEITKTDHLPADSILAIVENTPVNYLKLATDIINMLKLQSVNRKIRAALKDPKNHTEGLGYLAEKRKINDKNKQ